ncbi:MAG TPA: chemotaxis protein CheW, partial [Acidobacteriota bacterium]|nr:chemotaxis protein CheW [Acidobacteriota bacterium]
VKKAAVRQGFISERAADFLNEQETFLLMTRPGFSTANEVSDVSGRGVGLDVVRSKIDSLGGQLKIHSVPGSFTRFDIVVPFTLAVIRVFIVRSGENHYAIPFAHIEKFLQFKKEDLHYTQGRPVVFYDNSTMFVEDLQSLLSGSRKPEFPDEVFTCVSEHQNRRIAWCIDEIVAEKHILARPLAQPFSLLGCYTGATVLGRGDVIAILDLEQLYRESFQ